MLKIYKTDSEGKLQEIPEFEKGCWVNLIRPSEQEIRQVVQQLNINSNFIRDALDEEERSRIEKEDNQMLIIVDIPVVNQDEDRQVETYDTLPLGMIITDNAFITVCLRKNPILERFVSQKVKQFFTYKKARFVLQILYVIATYYLNYLKRINRSTDQIEKELHQSLKNQELFSLLALEKSLVYFTTSLKANNLMTQKLLKGHYMKMYADDQDLLEDVIIENKQAIEMAEIYSTILSGMMDAFASVISNNVNNVMKVLTSITIILSVPIMVASLYGMNVSLPGQDDPHAFTIIMLVSLILSSLTAIIFWKKRYF
jgi:magnesium transporter